MGNHRNTSNLIKAKKEEWSDGEKRFSEAIWISAPSMITPCSIRGTTVEAHINPIMQVNVLPWHLAYTRLGNVTSWRSLSIHFIPCLTLIMA